MWSDIELAIRLGNCDWRMRREVKITFLISCLYWSVSFYEETALDGDD